MPQSNNASVSYNPIQFNIDFAFGIGNRISNHHHELLRVGRAASAKRGSLTRPTKNLNNTNNSSSPPDSFKWQSHLTLLQNRE